METKVCKECGQSLPKSNFSKNKATKMGWQTIVRSVTKKEDANPVGA